MSLDAERVDANAGSGFVITHVLRVGGAPLRLVTTMNLANPESLARTYTVYAGDAPFARRADTFMTEGAWRHVGEDRVLTAGESAQVRAFLRALAAIPDAEAAWQEGLTDLMSLQYPFDPF